MDKLIIPATDESPQIEFDPKNALLSIVGNSISENAERFYEPILEWVKLYVTVNPIPTQFNINLQTLNISSAKSLTSMLNTLKQLIEQEIKLSINWIVNNNDEHMQELAEDYQNLLGINFKLISSKNEPEKTPSYA